jgi:hypothetical protein
LRWKGGQDIEDKLRYMKPLVDRGMKILWIVDGPISDKVINELKKARMIG